MVDSCVEPAISATENTIISIAGSASEAIIISREAPRPPKLVPTSIPASASAKRALPSRAVMAIRSPDQLNIRLAAKVGISAAATQVDGEDEIRRDAEQPGGVFGDHGFLAQQPPQVAIGLHQRTARGGAAAGLSPCAPARSAAATSSRITVICTSCASRRSGQIIAISSAPAAAPPGRRRRSRDSAGWSGTAARSSLLGDPADARGRAARRAPSQTGSRIVRTMPARAVVAGRRHVHRLAGAEQHRAEDAADRLLEAGGGVLR